MEKNSRRFRTMVSAEADRNHEILRGFNYKNKSLHLQEETNMTVQSIITMMVCLVPVWGGLISYLVKLIKLEEAGEGC